MNNKNILLNLLILFSSITILNLQSAARSIETETQLIDSDEIIKAIFNKKKDIAIKLIKSKQFNLNFKNENGTSALDAASHKGYVEIVQLLLKHGVNVNNQDNGGLTALMLSFFFKTSTSNNAIIVKLLLKHGADLYCKTKDDNTALMLASSEGHAEIVKLFLEHGTDVNIQNKKGWSALMVASQGNHAETVKLLLEYDADINAKKNDGYTALEIATQNEHTEIIKLIKDQKTINDYNEKIFKTYQQNDIKTCKLLLNDLKEMFPTLQPFIKLKNKEKNTLLHEAVIKRDYAFIEYILINNPEVISDLFNMPNKDGMTPIDLAVTDKYLLNYFINLAYALEN